ncbi:SMAD/FHA domain-containing protein [Suillus ampliporus]|nr:SMAD/FHA domain-containing protein [Suillus ampliporus]
MPVPCSVTKFTRNSVATSKTDEKDDLTQYNVNQRVGTHTAFGACHLSTRRRSAGNVNGSNTAAPIIIIIAHCNHHLAHARTTPPLCLRHISNNNHNHPTHRIRLVPHLDSRRTLRFEPISRDIRDGDTPLRIGRFTDRSGIAFKSKVVSLVPMLRSGSDNDKFYIKDTKSSSGTFLNQSPSKSCRALRANLISSKMGDIVQLGVDYQGGIRVEVGRERQAAPNWCSTPILFLNSSAPSCRPPQQPQSAVAHGKEMLTYYTQQDLFAVTIRQALFVAPRSHAFHYKCIRPLLEAHSSAFSCPLCHMFADLDEEPEIEIEPEAISDDDDGEDEAVSRVKSSLAPPMVRDRAEMEVEGNASSRIRTAGHVLHPHLPEGGRLEYAGLDEEMMDMLDIPDAQTRSKPEELICQLG